MEAEAETVRAEGAREPVTMLRRFEPGQQVAARLEISTGGWLKGADAGIDVMGDGSQVAFAGGMRRRGLESPAGESEIDAVRRELSG
jgi:hypothetical protein